MLSNDSDLAVAIQLLAGPQAPKCGGRRPGRTPGSPAGVHPFDARRHPVDAWVRVLTTEPLSRTSKPMAASSIARRLSAVSAFYHYGIGVDVLGFSPVANVRRPRVSDDSTTVGLSTDELVALLDAADAHSPRWGALVSLLAYNGVRIDEALAADVGDYTYQRGHRVLRTTRKGGPHFD